MKQIIIEEGKKKTINIINATKDDIEYANKLLESGGIIKQADLRDNMSVLEYNEKGELCETIRSAKLEREYQEWQEEVKALKVEPIKGIGGTIDPLKTKMDKEIKSRTITISKGDIPLVIDIISPWPASTENGNISDIDYALRILQEWDNETVFMLRGNMGLREKNDE